MVPLLLRPLVPAAVHRHGNRHRFTRPIDLVTRFSVHSTASWINDFPPLVFVGAQDGYEGFLRDIDAAELLHLRLSLLLLFEQLFLSRYVAAVQLCRDVFSKWSDGCSGDDCAADGSLDGNFELMPRNFFGESFTVVQSSASGLFAVDEVGKCVDGFLVNQDVDFDDVGLAIFDGLVVKRSVASRDHLELAIKIEQHFTKWHLAGDFDATGREIVHGLALGTMFAA